MLFNNKFILKCVVLFLVVLFWLKTLLGERVLWLPVPNILLVVSFIRIKLLNPMLICDSVACHMTTDHRAIVALLLCFGLLLRISVAFSISSTQLLPPVIFQTLVHYHPLSLCCHWFLCVLTSLTSPRTESKKWDMLCWVGNMTYLPTHSDKLSHVSCRVIFSLVDLFHLTCSF